MDETYPSAFRRQLSVVRSKGFKKRKTEPDGMLVDLHIIDYG